MASCPAGDTWWGRTPPSTRSGPTTSTTRQRRGRHGLAHRNSAVQLRDPPDRAARPRRPARHLRATAGRGVARSLRVSATSSAATDEAGGRHLAATGYHVPEIGMTMTKRLARFRRAPAPYAHSNAVRELTPSTETWYCCPAPDKGPTTDIKGEADVHSNQSIDCGRKPISGRHRSTRRRRGTVTDRIAFVPAEGRRVRTAIALMRMAPPLQTTSGYDGTRDDESEEFNQSEAGRQAGRQATLKQRLDEVHHDYYGADDGLRISRQHFLGVKAQTSGNVPCR